MMNAHLSYETTFMAEHQPPRCPAHVNEFRLVVTAEGALVSGVVVPFDHLEAVVANVLRCIEAVPPIVALPDGSSVERIAVWIWDELARGLPNLVEVRLHDGPFAVTYRGGR